MAKKLGVHGTDLETGRAREALAGSRKDKVCNLSHEAFARAAQPLVLSIKGNNADIGGIMVPKEMSTGSVGFHTNGSVVMVIDGVPVECTWQAQVILKHTKPKE